MAIQTRHRPGGGGGGGGGGTPGRGNGRGGGRGNGSGQTPGVNGGGVFWDNEIGIPAPTTNAYADLPWVNPSDPHFASKTRGNIARAQWEDYKARFRPYEDALFNAVNNPDILKADLQHADQMVGMGFDTSAGEYQRHLGRYGIQAPPAEQAAFGRQQALAEAGAKVAAENATRQNYRDRNLEILHGTGNGVSQLLNQTGGN